MISRIAGLLLTLLLIGCDSNQPKTKPFSDASSKPGDEAIHQPDSRDAPDATDRNSLPEISIDPEPSAGNTSEKRMLPLVEDDTIKTNSTEKAQLDGETSTVENRASNQSENSQQPIESEETQEEPPTPQEALSDAFAPPPDAKSLSRDSFVWVDREKQRVYVDGYLAVNRGLLEMFACPMGTKEHESLVATVARAKEIHAALLAIGATPGTTAQFAPEFIPPTGQRIRVWVCYRDKDDEFYAVDGRSWVRNTQTKKALDADWVFAGSGFWQDPDTGQEFYQADSGDMICVSNFSTAMMDIGVVSSADADSLLFEPFVERMPDRFTLLRLVLEPIPIPSDNAPNISRRHQRPDESVLPAAGK